MSDPTFDDSCAIGGDLLRADLSDAALELAEAGCAALAGDLLADPTAGALAELFKVLANDNRLRIRHAIHLAGEITPSEIADMLGASQQAVSNQLQRLADQRIVHARREGQRVGTGSSTPACPASWTSACACSANAAADATALARARPLVRGRRHRR